MAILDLQGMELAGGGGGNSDLSVLCHSSHSVTICL